MADAMLFAGLALAGSAAAGTLFFGARRAAGHSYASEAIRGWAPSAPPVGRKPQEHATDELSRLPLLKGWTATTLQQVRLACLTVSVTVSLLLSLLWGVASWGEWVVTGCIGWITPSLLLGVLHFRRQEAMSRDYLALVSYLALQLESGSPLTRALSEASRVVREPMRSLLIDLSADLKIRPWAAALHEFGRRSAHPLLEGFVSYLLQQQALGVDLPRILREEEARYLRLRRRQVLQRIETAKVTMVIFAFITFINGFLVPLLPLAAQYMRGLHIF